MNSPHWVSVRKAMRTDVTLIDGRMNVLEALRLMRDGRATSLIVEKRSDKDEYGILTLSDIATLVAHYEYIQIGSDAPAIEVLQARDFVSGRNLYEVSSPAPFEAWDRVVMEPGRGFAVNLLTNLSAGIAGAWTAWWSVWALIGWGAGLSSASI